MPTTQTATATPSEAKQTEFNWKENGAPYVEPVKEMLGDKHLNPEEAVAREREDLLRIESKKKIWGQEELEDRERAGGPRMPWTELLSRIRKCNPAIQVKDGKEGSLALYLHKREDEYTDIDNILLWQPSVAHAMNIPVPKDEFFIHHKYLTGFDKHPMPEYSYVTVDSSHIAHREYRSWRSVLIALIKAKAITYAAAIEEFGDPSGDKRCTRWFEQLQKYR